MSKVKRFSLEERYGYQNRKVIYDKNADNDIKLNNIYQIIDLLNQLDKQITDLQHRLEVAERTTKLACDLRNLNYRTFDNADIDFEQQFKEQAEKEKKRVGMEEKENSRCKLCGNEIVLGHFGYYCSHTDLHPCEARSEKETITINKEDYEAIVERDEKLIKENQQLKQSQKQLAIERLKGLR